MRHDLPHIQNPDSASVTAVPSTSSTKEVPQDPTPFKLNQSIFNPQFYTRVLNIWFKDLPSNTVQSIDLLSARIFTHPPIFTLLDLDYEDVVKALEYISPAYLRLPEFASYERDRRENYDVIGRLFMSEVSKGGGEGEAIEQAEVALALLLLLDQFSRIMYHASSSSSSSSSSTSISQLIIYNHYDRIARSIHSKSLQLNLVDSPGIKENIVRRFWFLMPLMHSEDLEDHETATKILEGWLAEVEGEDGEMTSMKIDFLKKVIHVQGTFMDILRKDGRFTHRDAVLGRDGGVDGGS